MLKLLLYIMLCLVKKLKKKGEQVYNIICSIYLIYCYRFYLFLKIWVTIWYHFFNCNTTLIPPTPFVLLLSDIFLYIIDLMTQLYICIILSLLKSLEKEEICTYTFFYDYGINFTLCFSLWIYMYQPEGLSLVFTVE